MSQSNTRSPCNVQVLFLVTPEMKHALTLVSGGSVSRYIRSLVLTDLEKNHPNLFRQCNKAWTTR